MNEISYRVVIIACGLMAIIMRYGYAERHPTKYIKFKRLKPTFARAPLYGPTVIIGAILLLQIVGLEILPFSLHTVPDTITRTCGLILGLVAIAGILWPQFVREDTWSSPMTSPDQIVGHKLITSGPYKYIRHPFYAACILGVLAVELTLASMLVFILPPLLLLMVVLGVRHEERQLTVVYGETFKAYQAKSWRLIPPIY
jgi:protein-S-isoprenylcysteine O-methyltransferase Ste14